MDPRKPIFDAVRAVARPGLFSDDGNILALDNLLDAFDVPRAGGPLTIGQKGIDLIQKWEGYSKDLGDGRVQAYPDPATGGDPWTIGWGTTGPDVTRGTVWTREHAHKRFLEHLDQFSAGVASAVEGVPTTQAEFDALVSLAYNIGLGAFRKSTLLKKHKAGDHAGAAAEFAKWVNAGGKRMQGLVNRRAEEARLYRGEV